jgi:hypothetical protein
MIKWALTFISCVLISVSEAKADGFRFETVSTTPVEFNDLDKGECTHRMSGQIGQDSVEVVKAALIQIPGQYHDDKNFLVCVEGSGGNLAAAFEIGRLLQTAFFGTILEPRVSCLSACAIVFMHGKVAAYETHFPFRMMHSSSRLGFHAPALPVSGQSDTLVPLGEALKAYDAAMLTVANVVRGALGQSEGLRILPLPLIVEMLSTPHTEFRYVETLGDAFRWNIDIYPHGLKAPSGFNLEVGYYQMCANLSSYATDDSFLDAVQTEELVRLHKQIGHFTRPPALPGFNTIKFDGMQEVQCQFQYVAEHDYFDVRLYHEGEQVERRWLEPVYLFSPNTPLASLH